MKTTLNQVKQVLPTLCKAKVTPFIYSSPALGKSSMVKQVADELNLEFIDVRLSQMDVTDLNGLPNFKNNKSTYVPFDVFPLQGDNLPDGKKGWLILLDEMTSAPMSIQAGAYRLILDREIGQNKLHDKVFIIACGNLETDNAIVNPISTALVSRFANFYVEPNLEEWQEWAVKNHIHPMITSYLGFKPSAFYTFNPDSSQPYASPRTWEMVNRVMGKTNSINLITLASLLGDGVALEFDGYMQCFNDLPSIEKVIDNPSQYKIPDSIATQWATLGMVVSCMDKYPDECITYLKRFPLELHIVILREIKGRYPKLLAKKEIRQWLTNLSMKL